MRESILPIVQYFAYIEIDQRGRSEETSLWASMEDAAKGASGSKLAMRRVAQRSEIWAVFSELFARSLKKAVAA